MGSKGCLHDIVLYAAILTIGYYDMLVSKRVNAKVDLYSSRIVMFVIVAFIITAAQFSIIDVTFKNFIGVKSTTVEELNTSLNSLWLILLYDLLLFRIITRRISVRLTND